MVLIINNLQPMVKANAHFTKAKKKAPKKAAPAKRPIYLSTPLHYIIKSNAADNGMKLTKRAEQLLNFALKNQKQIK